MPDVEVLIVYVVIVVHVATTFKFLELFYLRKKRPTPYFLVRHSFHFGIYSGFLHALVTVGDIVNLSLEEDDDEDVWVFGPIGLRFFSEAVAFQEGIQNILKISQLSQRRLILLEKCMAGAAAITITPLGRCPTEMLNLQ